LRFGSLRPVEEAAIERYPVGRSLFDVRLSDQGLEVRRDGRKLFVSDAPVEIRHVRFSPRQVRCQVRTAAPGVRLWIGDGPPRELAEGTTDLAAAF
jgi:hypothetical protein